MNPFTPHPLEPILVDLIHEVRNKLNSIGLEATDLSEQASFGVPVSSERLQSYIQDCATTLRSIRHALIPEPPQPYPIALHDLLVEVHDRCPPEILASAQWPEEEILAQAVVLDANQVVNALVDVFADALLLAESRYGFGLTLLELEPSRYSLRLAFNPKSLPQDIESWGHRARAQKDHPSLRRYQISRILQQNGGTCAWVYSHPHLIIAADFGSVA